MKCIVSEKAMYNLTLADSCCCGGNNKYTLCVNKEKALGRHNCSLYQSKSLGLHPEYVHSTMLDSDDTYQSLSFQGHKLVRKSDHD